jgi:hypothetical protein
MIDQWFYFGCHREAGHYLFREGMFRHYYVDILPGLKEGEDAGLKLVLLSRVQGV